MFLEFRGITGAVSLFGGLLPARKFKRERIEGCKGVQTGFLASSFFSNNFVVSVLHYELIVYNQSTICNFKSDIICCMWC